MKHEMKLQPFFFEKLRSQEKIYEIRLNDEKRQKVKVGDIITFRLQPELLKSINTKVMELTYFKSIKEMLEKIPLKDLGFEHANKLDVEEVYRRYYAPEQESKYGVVAIKVELA